MIIIETDRTQAHTDAHAHKAKYVHAIWFDAISSIRMVAGGKRRHQTIRRLRKIMFFFLSRTPFRFVLSLYRHTHLLKPTFSLVLPLSSYSSVFESLFITFCSTRAFGFQFWRQTHTQREKERASLSSFSCHSNELLCLCWMFAFTISHG